MAFRKTIAAATAVLLFAACDQSPTDPSQSTQIAVQTALMGGGSAFMDGGPQPAIMGRLFHAAIGRIHHDAGEDSAKAVLARMKSLVDAARTAHQAGDTAAAHAAMDAVRHAEAEVVIAAFGTDAVTRSLTFATSVVAHLDERIAKATANGEELTRLKALSASLNQILTDAKASAAAGDNVSALLGASKVVEALHIVNAHREMGPRGSLPLDTTRVHRGR